MIKYLSTGNCELTCVLIMVTSKKLNRLDGLHEDKTTRKCMSNNYEATDLNIFFISIYLC